MRLGPALVVGFLLTVPSLAVAGSYYLEGPEVEAKTDASEDAKEAASDGLDARVVRRMGMNSGWRYVVRIDGLTEEASARSAASKLASATNGPVAIYSISGDQAALVAMVGEVGSASPAVAPAPAKEGADPNPLLDAAVGAHKVGGLVLDGKDLRFAFRRTLSSGGVADHVWARQGESIYVSVEPVSGEVTASRLKVVGDKGWLSVDGGAWEEQNLEKTRQTALDLGPTSVLPFLLVLDPARQTRRELQRMQHIGRERLGDLDVDVLHFEGDQAAGPVRVEIGAADQLVRRVSFDSGELVYEFSDFGKLGGLWLPQDVTTRRRGEVVDRVRITELELAPKLPEAWFKAP
jgi:hypothetical protein